MIKHPEVVEERQWPIVIGDIYPEEEDADGVIDDYGADSE